MEQITIGSLFSGIGGFELGLERAIPNSKTIWQVEQNKYCQGILKKHWPEAILHNDIREVNHENVHPVSIICGGFPCQGVSCSGKGKGIEGDKRSGLWREMYRLIYELQPRVAVMENVPALLWKGRGMHVVMSNLAQIGYDAEWTIISARQFGAPHLRKRVFIIAYPNSATKKQPRTTTEVNQFSKTKSTNVHKKNLQYDRKKNLFCKNLQHRRCDTLLLEPAHTNMQHVKEQPMHTFSVEKEQLSKCGGREDPWIYKRNYWQRTPIKSALCRVDDGISGRVDRIKALGNAIVPQCSEYIGRRIWESGLLD